MLRPDMRRAAVVLFFVVSALVTAKLVAWLGDGVPTLQTQHGWFWSIRPGHPGVVLLALACFAAPVCVWLAAKGGLGGWGKGACAIVLFGFVLQHGLAFSENRGWEGMRDRIVRTGHAEFALTATRGLSALDVVRNYETFVRDNDLPYARSKPPGQLLFYMACAPVADRVMPLVWDPPRPNVPQVRDDRHWRLVSFATLFFPLISMLPVFPLAYLASALLGRDKALWPPLLFVLVPQVQLVTLHLDQVLYPLLVALLWAAAAKATQSSGRRAIAWWAAAGAMLWIGLFVTFSLLPAIVPLVFVVFLVEGATVAERAKKLALGLAASLVALGVLAALFRLALHYDPFVAYQRGFKNHVAWNGWQDEWRWPAAKLDLSELAYWTGAPVVLAFFVACFARVRRPRAVTVFAWATLAAILVTASIGKTLGEIARLWIFFVPAIVVAAADGIAVMIKRRKLHALLGVAAIQLAWMVALKRFQDFR